MEIDAKVVRMRKTAEKPQRNLRSHEVDFTDLRQSPWAVRCGLHPIVDGKLWKSAGSLRRARAAEQRAGCLHAVERRAIGRDRHRSHLRVRVAWRCARAAASRAPRDRTGENTRTHCRIAAGNPLCLCLQFGVRFCSSTVEKHKLRGPPMRRGGSSERPRHLIRRDRDGGIQS